MKSSFRVRNVLMVLIGAAALSMPLLAQDRGDRGERGDRGDRRRQFDPAQREQFMQRMRERMNEMMKQRLNAGDDEWSVIEPRLTKVMEMRMRSGFGGMRGMFRGRGPGGPDGDDRDDDRPQRELSPVQQKARALNEVVEKEDSSPEQIKAAMDALRAARAKQEAEAEAARESLREVLTLRQEATLVTMGILD